MAAVTTDTPTSDRTALYAAICAAPGEDTPRLVLADWLDENGDSADADLAEFIRVQVGLASIDPAHTPLSEDGYDHPDGEDCAICDRVTELTARESALLAKHRANWLRAGACPTCRPPEYTNFASRGGNALCNECDGTGDIGMLPTTTDFARGFPHRVTVPTLAAVWGAKGPTPRARAWVTHFPIAEIVAQDREPSAYAHSMLKGVYGWLNGTREHEPFWLPEEVWKSLDRDEYELFGPWADYPTRELALTALAKGLAQAVRGHP